MMTAIRANVPQFPAHARRPGAGAEGETTPAVSPGRSGQSVGHRAKALAAEARVSGETPPGLKQPRTIPQDLSLFLLPLFR